MKDFKDKVMFITGAAHGFGRVIAEEGGKTGDEARLSRYRQAGFE
jgi:NAD(P)-dependent dehydrogenase (short-subunit alcohol dehydrogenase family)